MRDATVIIPPVNQRDATVIIPPVNQCDATVIIPPINQLPRTWRHRADKAQAHIVMRK
jgi:hypothetical protein